MSIINDETISYKKLEGPKGKTKLFYFIVFACPILTILLLLTNNIFIRAQYYYSPGDIFVTKTQIENEFSFKILETEFDLNLDLNEDLPDPPVPNDGECSAVSSNRVDCQPRGNVTAQSCLKLGCCYSTTSQGPYCFYPSNYSSYSIISMTNSTFGLQIDYKANFKSPFSKTLNYTLLFKFINNETLQIEIVNNITPKKQPKMPKDLNPLYRINVTQNGFQVIRKSNNLVLFDTVDIGGFHVASLFFQMTTRLPSENIYGLGDNIDDFPINLNWKTKTIFTHDSIPSKSNGYSYLPAYLCVENDQKAHYVVLNTYTAADFVLQPGALTVRTIQGKNIDITISLGDSALNAISNVKKVLRDPYLPPYWSLGFHLSRFGYRDTAHLMEIWTDMINAKIPFDTQWVDIDYMNNRNDFTLSPKFKDLPNFTKLIHTKGMKLVLILDPGVSSSEPKGSYPPYDIGIKRDIFIKDNTGEKPFIGQVWNRNGTAFVDFLNPEAEKYWSDMISQFYKTVQFDGLWIDMNEPSNLVNGSISGCPKDSPLENPPYVPNVAGGFLQHNTICMSALHQTGYYPIPHYLAHNVYGTEEQRMTNKALINLLKKRPFTLSRSVNLFSTGHWTGDVVSSWKDMAQSVKDLLNYAVFGISMVGADICGFNGNTTVELCRRWSQLGAFYPFSRNHNSDDNIAQDPVSLGIVASTKAALEIRYSLLPYLYTLFWEDYQFGLPVVRPSYMMFSDFQTTKNITSQFFLGESLLVIPVLDEGFTYVHAYLANDTWYDLRTNEKIKNKESSIVLPAPVDIIPLLIRGGRIIPMQIPGMTTTQTRKNDMYLKVALAENQQAVGNIYIDDGESLNPLFSTVGWYASQGQLESHVEYSDFKTNLRLKKIIIMSIPKVKKVTIGNETCQFTYDSGLNVLTVQVDVPVVSQYILTWDFL